jgi:hypothetical protein
VKARRGGRLKRTPRFPAATLVAAPPARLESPDEYHAENVQGRHSRVRHVGGGVARIMLELGDSLDSRAVVA